MKAFKSFIIDKHVYGTIPEKGLRSRLYTHMLHKHIKENKTDQDMIVYHGSSYGPNHPLRNPQKTNEHTIVTIGKRFSTSKSLKTAMSQNFAFPAKKSNTNDAHVFHIQVPKGTHHLELHQHDPSGEHEVLFHPGVKLKVEKKPFKSTTSHDTTIHHWKSHMIHDGV